MEVKGRQQTKTKQQPGNITLFCARTMKPSSVRNQLLHRNSGLEGNVAPLSTIRLKTRNPLRAQYGQRGSVPQVPCTALEAP